MHVNSGTKGMGARGPRLRLGLQPVPAWHPPSRFEFRDSSGSTGGRFRREPSDHTVAQLEAADSDRSAAGPAEYRNRGNRSTVRAYALRQEYLADKEQSLRVVPHAVHRF